MSSNSDARSSHPKRELLAVIGIGCRFPGGLNSPTEFWDALLDGINAIRDVPEDRWKHERFHDTDPEKSGAIRNAKGGFIDGIDLFDGEFFGHFPTEAQRIDPQQRLLLEVTHEAMEDAGLRRDQLDNSRTAVFVGSFMYDYLCMQSASEQRDEISAYVAMGTAICSLANRISYDFNLKGPSVTLDTACSASLTALHLACQSVWTGEADMAIAAGVNLMLRPEPSIMLSKGGFLNPDQYCKAFDQSANGYVRGEGVGVVMLKPLRQAVADGDAIYACVRGTGINQDGFTPEGFTVPNVSSQVALLEDTYAAAGIDPLAVDFVEAHGTGTSVGDPVESAALGAVLGFDRTPEQPNLMIGSVKTNLGHLEGAAGIAGFIKAVLTTHHGIAPPNLHFNDPNPEIPWEHYRLEVPTKPTRLKRKAGPLAVGVNSFGAGGANAHVVLEATTQSRRRRKSHSSNGKPRAIVYTISAANRDSLQSLAIRHADLLRDSQYGFEDIAYSAFTRRSHYAKTMAVVGDSRADIENKLRSFADGQVDSETLSTTIAHKESPKLAFVFSGQGGQWVRMGLQLMQREPVFRKRMEKIDCHFKKLSGWSLLKELRRGKKKSKINDTIVVQPTVMAIQLALVKLYKNYGIQPDGVVGHSIGEVAAGFASGALTLKQAVQVIYHRSQAQNLASGKGGMLAVGLSLDDARELIEDYEGVWIGTVNGPEMLTLSGDTEPLQEIATQLESQGIFNRTVQVQVAYHSHHMDSIKDIMLDSLAHVQGGPTSIPLYSTVTTRCEDGTHLNADYWYENVRQPVLFTDTLSRMLDNGFDTFVEIGPHPVLVRGAEDLIKKQKVNAMAAPSMTRSEPEHTVFLQSLARLAARGLKPDTETMFGAKCNYVRLPKYPWQHNRYWFETPGAAAMRHGQFEHPFLKRQTKMATEVGLSVWEATLGVFKFPYLRDHQVDGEIVFPATGHLELAWAVAAEQFRDESFFLEELHFDLPLILPDNTRHPAEIRMEIVSNEGDYRICSRPGDAPTESPWTSHSSGRINKMDNGFAKPAKLLDDLQTQFQDAELHSVEEFYSHLHDAGLIYGQKFQCIQELRHCGDSWLAALELPDDLVYESQRKTVHPALLDACLHVVFADTHRLGNVDRIYLPFRIGRVRFHRRPTQKVWAHVRITRNDEQFLCSDTVIFDDAGNLVAEVLGLDGKRLVGAGANQADNLYEGCYEYEWQSTPRDSELHGRIFDSNRAVLFSDDNGVAEELADRLAGHDIESNIVSIRQPTDVEEALADLPLDRRALIVFAAGLSTEETSWQSLSECPYVPSLLQLAQTLHEREGVPRLFIVTNGAAGVAGDESLDLGQSILHGMARVLRNECPQVSLAVVDLSDSITADEIDGLENELLHTRRDQDETEIALRGGERYVRRLVAVDRESAEKSATTIQQGTGGAYRAELSDAGGFEHVDFRQLSMRDPTDEEVEIEVEAAGLNFRDVMNVLGTLSETAVAGGLTQQRLGLEIAGRVLRAGRSVENVQPGDHVIARAAEGFCGRVVVNAHNVVRRPETLSAVQGAGVPVAFVTAWYSLCHLARMTKGETVLIHSASGGVGNAAIQVAQQAGATVIATAGTEEKREYLKTLGVEHVFDSRSLSFYNCVMEATDQRGVDIVLNSLSGPFIPQSMKCLAPFGRFVELGKTDIYRNSKMTLERLGENISYFVVDVDRLAAQKPDLHRQAFQEVATLFEQGKLKPHEVTEFPISQLTDAMKFMTRSTYNGKIVLNMQGDQIHTLPAKHAALRPDRSYLITGGTGGFGLEVARWMVDRGARHLVLLSRSGCKTPEDQSAVDAMRELGVEVELAKADITDADAVRDIIVRVNRQLPLAGVIHGAAVMDDASIPAMNMDRFEWVFNPKAQGAWNLHEATLAADAKLDFFVLFSSISSVLGFVGQVNYAAANYFQDALAHFRRQQELPATSVNLGVLGQYAGLSRSVNEGQDVIGLLESQGMYVMPLSDILGKLESAIIQQPVQRLTARLDWPWFRMAYPHLARDARFIEMMGDEALARAFRPKGTGLRVELFDMEPSERCERLEQELTNKLAQILDASPAKLDVSASIDVLGLDSLMLTDLQIFISRTLDITLPLIKLLKGPSIATLAAELVAQLDETDDDDAKIVGEDADSFTLADLDEVEVLNPWLIRGDCDADAPHRLVCFHSMGVGASLFTKFLLNPPDDYDILAVQTPGRENRLNEPVAEHFDELLDHIVPLMVPLFDRPLVVWGHSFGGVVGWEVLRRLREEYGLEPDHFVLTGTAAPHLMNRWQNREVLLKALIEDNSPEYLMSLSRYVDDPEFIKAILPGMRRDFPLLSNYRFQPTDPLRCPITAFAAKQDDFVYTDEIREWMQHTDGGFQLIDVEGDHWFLDRNRERIVAAFDEIATACQSNKVKVHD